MSPNHLIYAMLTHRGRVRHGNEDTCAAAPEIGAFVVCDGMGGAAAGEIASNLAADTFLAALRSPPSTSRRRRCEAAGSPQRCDSGRESRCLPAVPAVATACTAWARRWWPCCTPLSCRQRGEWRGLRAARRSPTNHTNSRVTDPPTLWLGHVGDSRCYRYRRGKLEQLTIDHSLVEEQLRAGQITHGAGGGVAHAQPDHSRDRLAGHR